MKCHSGSYSGFIGYIITRGECDPARFRPMQPETCNCKNNDNKTTVSFFSLLPSHIHTSACCVHTRTHTLLRDGYETRSQINTDG